VPWHCAKWCHRYQATEHGQHEPAVRCGGVAPRVTERLEVDTGFLEFGKQVQQFTHAAAEPVEPGDDNEATALERGNHSCELRPVGADPDIFSR
jgi:hypothetical protein